MCEGNEYIVRYLVEHGADVNAEGGKYEDRYGWIDRFSLFN
jgi:hypothetical protein